MLSLKQLLYKPVYDQNGAELGKLRDILLFKKDGKGVVATDSATYAADTVSTRKGKIILENISKSENGAQLTGKSLYGSDGKYLGEIYDVTFGKTLKIAKIASTNGEEYERGRICATSDIVIVKNKTPIKPQKKAVRKQIVKPTNEHMRTPTTDTLKNATYPIRRRYGDFSFLLGKAVDKNITNFYGEVMIRAGDKVTNDTLRQAKLSGKLIELCLHAQ